MHKHTVQRSNPSVPSHANCKSTSNIEHSIMMHMRRFSRTPVCDTGRGNKRNTCDTGSEGGQHVISKPEKWKWRGVLEVGVK